MNFRKLNKHIQQGIKALTLDEEFQKRFGSDEILDQLDQQKYNPTEQLLLFQSINNEKIEIYQQKIKPITPKIWTFLWIIDSPFINTKKEISQVDIDIFLYLMQNQVKDIIPSNIVSEAVGYCQKNNIDYEVAVKIIYQAMRLAFKPLSLFPKSNISGNVQMYYDSEWLTGTIAKVHAVTGLFPEQIMNMSLTAICYYFAQFAKMNGAENIYRRSPEEILDAQDKRCCELIVQRLIENGVIKEEQRFEIYNIISTPEQK